MLPPQVTGAEANRMVMIDEVGRDKTTWLYSMVEFSQVNFSERYTLTTRRRRSLVLGTSTNVIADGSMNRT
jgi:hypothetical protein